MQNIKIAAPTFILRQEAERDLFGALEKIAALGFDGVEFLGYFGQAPQRVRQKLDEVGLIGMGNHLGARELLADPEGVLAANRAVGCTYLTLWGPPREAAPGEPAFEEGLQLLARAAALVRQAGLVPLYHNHDNEFAGPRPTIDALLAAGEAGGLGFEPDVGWITFTGKDPAAYLEKYRDRCPVIHLKDVYADDFSKVRWTPGLAERENDPANGGFAFRPTGYGVVNFPALMPKVLACKPRWLVADHDCAYGRSPYDELGMSLDYLRGLLALMG